MSSVFSIKLKKRSSKMSSRKRNWSEYNKQLVNRGNIFLWIDKTLLDEWVVKKKKKGRPAFSPAVIQAGLFIKRFYKCPFRALQGFLNSLIGIMKQKVSSPHYSLFCKRAEEVSALLPKISKTKSTELILDSSGLKIKGEGEWKDKVHRSKTRKSWIKLHIAIDPQTQEMTASVVSDETVGDPSAAFSLIDQAPGSVKTVYGDGAYDRKSLRKHLFEKGIDPCIPPRRGGKLHKEEFMRPRNDALLAIRGLGNDEEAFSLWKKLSRYNKRSLVESAFSRLKTIFGNRLNSRKLGNQKAEILFQLHALNRMLRI